LYIADRQWLTAEFVRRPICSDIYKMIKYHEKNGRPRSRVKQRSNTPFYIICISILIFVVIFYVYSKQQPSDTGPYIQDNLSGIIGKLSNSFSEKKPLSPAKTLPENTDVAGLDSIGTVASVKNEKPLQLLDKRISDESTGDPVVNDAPDHLIKKLNSFYDHLDQQSYMKDFGLKQPSRIHFSNLLQNLLDHPPVVSNETNDLFTLLKNTAHFFRILGKNNILILKGILDREKTSFEHILRTFYTLTDSPEILLNEYNLILPKESLYDYAGFFLNTMGGRLYLFRRDSASRMTVSFYAILIIDKANDEGYNKYGIDLRPAIDFLIEEIENTGRHLTLKESYLDKLYDLKEKYN